MDILAHIAVKDTENMMMSNSLSLSLSHIPPVISPILCWASPSPTTYA